MLRHTSTTIPKTKTFTRASTTSAVLATLDDRLTLLKQQAKTEKDTLVAHDKVVQRHLREVLDTQREIKLSRNNPTGGPPLKSGPTAAGLALAEKHKEKEREAARERERQLERQNSKGNEENVDSMDVDEPGDGKGKGR